MSTNVETRRFPIQRDWRTRSPEGTVSWADAERAYATYARLFGRGQTLERLAERGGFGPREFACLWSGHEPRAGCECAAPTVVPRA